MSMETTPAASLPLEVKPTAPVPRKSQGRPRKYIAPTDGSPVPREVQEAIARRARDNRAYHANPEAKSARVYANYKKRMEKQREELLRYEELKRALAALPLGLLAVHA